MWEEVAGDWRRLHNEELYNLYASPDIIKVIKSRSMRWERHIACMGEMRSACTGLVRKYEGTRPFGRSRCRWKDNITDLRNKVGNMYWTHLT
jgi:hypothetical protein